MCAWGRGVRIGEVYIKQKGSEGQRDNEVVRRSRERRRSNS